jgi:hypothetical protein
MSKEVIVAVIGVLGVVAAALIGRCTAPAGSGDKIPYVVVVLDDTEPTGIVNAAVSITGSGVVQNDVTDMVGKHIFALDTSLAGKDIVVRANKAGYHAGELQNIVPPKDGGTTLRLVKLRPPVPVPVASNPTRVSESLSFSSGPKPSGSRKDFSGWYELCSGALPSGSAIESVSFVLAGDRSCGAWAECREKERTSSRACWEFRLQGHDEWPGSGQANSEGTLRLQISRPAS